MKEIGIYKIENKVNNKCYIGSSKNIKKRWQEHKRTLKKGTHHSKALQNAWNKYGEENFIFEILCNCLFDELLIKEQEYFNIIKPEYIILKVAGRFDGYKHTDETKKILREKSKEQIRKPCSLETKKKIGDANRNRIFSAEHIEKLSKAHLNKKLSVEHIDNIKKHCTSEKMSERQKKTVEVRKQNNTFVVNETTRNKIGLANSKIVVGINEENKIVYEFNSYKEAARFLNKSEGTVWRYIKNNIKYNNLIWKRKMDYVP